MSRILAIATASASTAAVLVGLWAWQSHTESPKRPEPTEASHAQAPDQDVGVTLTQQAQERAGIVTAEARSADLPTPGQAIATILPLQDLIDSASTVASLRAQVERAQAALAASRSDHERLKSLHSQDRNVSDRALESAEATWRSDEASARSAAIALQAAEAGNRARWGAELATAMAARRNPWLVLASGQQVLLRVSSASGAAPVAMPASIDVELTSGRHVRARWLSVSPFTDPRVQGPAAFYTMDAHDALAGQTLQARFATSSKVAGAVLPGTALLWWQGRQWAYVEEKPGRFERQEASSAWRVDDGWFVPGFKPAKVVAQGAQSLLSQELHSAIQVEEDDK